MYILLLKVYCSSFLAVAACTFKWRKSTSYETMMNSLNRQHLLSSAVSTKKGKHGKYRVEVHNLKYSTCIWKEYRN